MTWGVSITGIALVLTPIKLDNKSKETKMRYFFMILIGFINHAPFNNYINVFE